MVWPFDLLFAGDTDLDSSYPVTVRDVPMPVVAPLPRPPKDLLFVAACEPDTSDSDGDELMKWYSEWEKE